jgi:hypothetical protein
VRVGVSWDKCIMDWVYQCKGGVYPGRSVSRAKCMSPARVAPPGNLVPGHHYTGPWPGPAVQCRAVQCSAVQCSAVQCSAVQCSAVQCSTVQCSAVQCSARLVILMVLPREPPPRPGSSLILAQGAWSLSHGASCLSPSASCLSHGASRLPPLASCLTPPASCGMTQASGWMPLAKAS